jgi:hypothetical protein
MGSLYGYDSLWLPASLLDESRQKQLTAALFAASRHQMVRFHIGKGMAGARPEVLAEVSQTATNPALLDAFTLVIVADERESATVRLFREHPPKPICAAPVNNFTASRCALRRVPCHSRKNSPDYVHLG